MDRYMTERRDAQGRDGSVSWHPTLTEAMEALGPGLIRQSPPGIWTLRHTPPGVVARVVDLQQHPTVGRRVAGEHKHD